MADTWVLDPKNKNRATYTDPDGRIFEVFNEDTSEVPMAGEEPLEYGVPRLVPPQKEVPEKKGLLASTFDRRLQEAQGERPGLDPENEFGGPKVFENGIPNPLSTIRDIADLGARGGEYIGAAFNTALEGMDNLVKADAKDFGSLDQITNTLGLPEIRPGAAIGALSEAFPLGGAEMGLTNPAAAAASAEYRTAISKAQDAFKKGGTRNDIKAASGIDYGPELDKAIEIRDSGGNARIGDAPEVPASAPKVDPALEQEAAVKQTAEMFGIPEDRIPAALEQPDFQNQVEVTLQQNRRGGIPEDEQALGARTPEEVPNDGRGAQPVEAAPEITEAPQADVVTRLTDALNNAGKASKEQIAMNSAERRTRIKEVLAARNSTEGEAGLRAELAQLKGEFPKIDFEGVRDKFSPEEVDGLFDQIKNSDALSSSVYDPIQARVGLAKLLDGELPTKSQIDLLGKVFPRDFVNAALKHRTKGGKALDFFTNAANLPRALMSSLDLSAPLRQGIFLVGRKEFYNSFGSMFKQFASEKAFKGVMDDIRSRDTFPLMEDSKLSLSTLGHDLTSREEAFVSQWADKIPVVGKAIRASERGYAGFLNKLRADTFDSIVKLSNEAGVDFATDPKALTDIASFVNNATGRGDLGKLNQAGPILNSIFFSPRLIASRVSLLRPDYYARLSPVVRKEALKSLVSLGALATTVLGLAKMGGADVEADPRSSDFGKIKTGNTRYDILGGFGQYITLGARLASNEKKTVKGDIQTLGARFGSPTRLDAFLNFGINKEAPIPSYITDFLRGKDAVGEPFDATDSAIKRMLPLFWQDAKEMVDEQGAAKGIPMAVPGLFGVGTQTYKVATQKDAFGRDPPTPEEAEKPETDPVVLEVSRLSEPMGKPLVSPPSATIRLGKTQTGEAKNRKLSDDEYTNYSKLSGYYLTEILKGQLSTPEWQEMDDIDRRKEVRKITTFAREQARNQLFNQPNSGGEEGTTDE